MRIGRTILVLLVALSVAILPATAEAMVGLGSMADAAADMSASEPMPCCPEDTDHGNKGAGCASMAACALKCFNFSAVSFVQIPFSPIPAGAISPLPRRTFVSQIGSVPFRPPRA